IEDPDELIDRELDRLIINRVVEKCYSPALDVIKKSLLEASERYGWRYSIGMSISGTLIEQLEETNPQVLEKIRELVSLDLLEIVAEPYYHSLASELSREEFEHQLDFSREVLKEKLGREPVGAVNTELIYRDEIGCWIAEKGFRYTIIEGSERIFREDPNHIYSGECGLKILARHYRLSDDISFRFNLRSWDQYPLTADKYAEWIYRSPGDLVVVYLDFETFGEHHPKESGILEFLEYLPLELGRRGVRIISPSQAIELFQPAGYVKTGETSSWADTSKDLRAWLGNNLQLAAFNLYKDIGVRVLRLGDEKLVRIWRILGEADHYHYMYYEPGSDFPVHDYFSYHESPRKAFESYLRALLVLSMALERKRFEKRTRRKSRRAS
ncbi:MAG: glycoside hydrolase family 57 protein, partial [Sulfolobales archaeon]